MGSLGDRDHDDDDVTHCLPFSGDGCIDKNFGHFSQFTSPFMDTRPLDDAIDTEVVNFKRETEVPFKDQLGNEKMNFEGDAQVLFEDAFETEVLNFEGETQVLDDFDGFENMDTKLLYKWNSEETDKGDGEESDKTDILCDDTEELSDNDSAKIISSFGEGSESASVSKQDDETNKTELDALCYRQITAGVKMNFTSLRVAALRACGLAARSKALNKRNSKLYSSEPAISPKEDLTLGLSDTTSARASLACAVGIDGGALGDDKLKKTIENSEVDDKQAEDVGLNYNCLDEVDEMASPLCNEIARLSYVDSQEPGDLSQENALDFVDKLLKTSDTDFAKPFHNVGSAVKKTKPISSIKGTKSLARKSGLRSVSGGTSIFDWDDNREDERGGEFFSRKKKALLDNKEKGLAHSCSASELHSSKRTVKKSKVAEVQKNLSKELDEQLKVDSVDEPKAATCIEEDLEDMCSVGPDTQMAAEAMEVLCLGLDVTDHENKDNNRITDCTQSGSFFAVKEDKKLPKKHSPRKRSGLSNSEDCTTMSKQRKTRRTNLNHDLTVPCLKQSKSVMKKNNIFDTSPSVSPSIPQAQVHNCAPIASRTRQHSVTRQSIGGNIKFDAIIGLSYKRGRRSHRGIPNNRHGPQFDHQKRYRKPCEILKKSRNIPLSISLGQGVKRKTRSSLRVAKVFPSSDRECESNKIGHIKGLKEDGVDSKLEVSPAEGRKLSVLVSISPASCMSSEVAASPICKGDEYLKQSCRKNLSRSLVKEMRSLVTPGPEFTFSISRRRREMANVQVLFSNHLDDDIIMDQKKILAKLGASVAPSIGEATHFVTDKFSRTRNMLEAIALGKPVVTPLWLESCKEAKCCIDEKNYILRDSKKEKEFGFSLPASLARACQHPLLKGLKVWITPSTKPGVEILSSLVKAVHGLPVERIGRSVLKNEKFPDDLLVLSCEEDYAACLPFIEKGGAVFSSELLLNGIVTQKLEYDRHRLFEDHIKKTRSTIWLKRESNQYVPVAKSK